MRSALAALAFCCTAAYGRTPEEVSFDLYKRHFGKKYDTIEEEVRRFQAFRASLARVAASGSDASGLTQFSDLTPEEFKQRFTGRVQPAAPRPGGRWDGTCYACKRFPSFDKKTFDSFDWTQHGAVTNIKNQGSCGSCWSFGTTGDIEGTWYLAGHPLTPLSEQQLVSCDTVDGGCGGGLQESAFGWLIKNRKGLTSEKDYPYVSGNGRTPRCRGNLTSVATITSWYQVSNSAAQEADIVHQLQQVGPVTIGIDATPMQDYVKGVDNPRRCSSTQLDHAVLIVGYGTDNGVDYWKIKNSWGTSWGESGYYRIVRGQNKCGVATDAVHSIV